MGENNVKKKTASLPQDFTQVLEMLPDAAYVLDDTGMILYVNETVSQRTGWTAADLIGQSIIDSLLFALPFRSTLLGAMRDHGSWQGDSERIMPDGSLRTVRALWQRLAHPIGSAHVVGIEHDISEYRARELEFEQARKLAKIGILSEGIAHELRNPLSYALSAAQLLSDAELPEEVRQKCIQTITTGVKKAGLIVDNMLSLGKPKSQFARNPVSIERVLSEAIDAAAAHPNYSDVRFTTDFPQEPLTVSGNHDMLVQVFHNVITNALNEMPDGGQIGITGNSEVDTIRVRITDTGPGVSDEQMKHLFDPFFSASTSGTGTGLGLTLSYYIMKEHAGSIEVESQPGAGATFVLTFPRVEVAGG